MDKILLLGGGGHAKVLREIIMETVQFEIVGILDPKLEAGTQVDEIPVLGDDDLLPELYAKGIKNVSISMGSIGDNKKRKALFKLVKEIGFFIPPLIHSRAIVSKESRIFEGVQIMAGAIIQAGSTIGENTIVNTGSIIEHDCTIGQHAHICPGAVVSGGCFIDEGSFIGAGATVIQGIKIGKNTIVGAGAVVINDLDDGISVKGIPAR